MADVGRVAHVSAQTVSRYLNDTGYVSADTRDRIKAAVDQLGYRPNQLARNLRVQRTQTVGVLSIGFLNYGNAAVLSGLESAARRQGFTLFISQLELEPTDPRASTEVHLTLERFMSYQVDGIAVVTPFPGTERLVGTSATDVPLVTVSGRPLLLGSSVQIDSVAAGRMATAHLIELGHRRILHIVGPRHTIESIDRERGYVDAVRRAGLEPRVTEPCSDWSADAGYRAGEIADLSSVSAVFTANDQIALGFLNAARRRGFSSPSDFSIIGIDDMPDARHFQPALSSVWMDFPELGRAAFDTLLRHIETGERQPPLVIPPQLRPRESTTRPANL